MLSPFSSTKERKNAICGTTAGTGYPPEAVDYAYERSAIYRSVPSIKVESNL